MTATGRSIDLNADLGEEVGDDVAMLGLVSSANIACGGHAGGPEAMFAALSTARDRGVVAGAHPGYADRANFGRVVVPMPPEAIGRLVAAQVGAACGVAALAGTRIAYVKAHGALYNLAATDAPVSRAICAAVRAIDPGLALLCLSGSVTERVARDMGMTVAAEIFADRAYLADGTLVPRTEAGAVIHDRAAVVARVLDMLRQGAVTAIDGTPLPLAMDSLCLHGDTPGAVSLAQSLRAAIQAEGWRVAPFAA
ncbi:MAG: LamB/YcsF family protein [Gemmobacter sp.]